MNNVLDRLNILRAIVKAGADNLPWCGNIAMQKLVYLLEHVYKADIGYEYGLHQLGPYSYDLASDLGLGEQAGLWRIISVNASSSNTSYTGKKYKVTEANGDIDKALRSVSSSELWFQEQLSALMCSVHGLTARDLELYATIHYLRTVQQVSSVDLWAVLHALKPKYSEQEFEAGTKKVAAMEKESEALVGV